MMRLTDEQLNDLYDVYHTAIRQQIQGHIRNMIRYQNTVRHDLTDNISIHGNLRTVTEGDKPKYEYDIMHTASRYNGDYDEINRMIKKCLDEIHPSDYFGYGITSYEQEFKFFPGYRSIRGRQYDGEDQNRPYRWVIHLI